MTTTLVPWTVAITGTAALPTVTIRSAGKPIAETWLNGDDPVANAELIVSAVNAKQSRAPKPAPKERRTPAEIVADVSARFPAVMTKLAESERSDSMNPYPFSRADFMRESLRIEGIHRNPTAFEMAATEAFLALRHLTVADMENLVSAYAPGHRLRDKSGMNVRVGDHIPPPGGSGVREALSVLLEEINAGLLLPYKAHVRFETLHPFSDGNGRSGRTLWLWMRRGDAPLGFLHSWYYDSLQNADERARPKAEL